MEYRLRIFITKIKIYRQLLSMFICLFISMIGSLPAVSQPLPAMKPYFQEWRKLARATVVVYGEVITVEPSTDPTLSKWLVFQFRPKAVLKGTAPLEDIRLWYVTEHPQAKSDTKINISVGKTAIVMLSRYITNDSKQISAFEFLAVESNSSMYQSIEKEIRNQSEIANRFSQIVVPSDRYSSVVRRETERLRDKNTLNQAVQNLQKLGMNAIPSLVRLMEDHRPLPHRFVEVPNPKDAPPGSPESLEEYASFRPREVIDAIDLVLVLITKEWLSTVCNGGTEKEQQHAIDAWRTYAYYTVPSLHRKQ